jgi:hypothetical protein
MTRPSDSPLIQAERRNWAYWREDGIPHLLGGLFFLAFGGSMWLTRLMRSPWFVALSLVLLFLFWLASRGVMEFLKARITWPRTGYAPPPFFAGFTCARIPPEPAFVSIGTAQAGEMELQNYRRRRFFRTQWLFAAFVVAENVARHLGWLQSAHLLWGIIAFGAALALYGSSRLALFLRHHRLERA